jgi:DNA (cytosine-5)-methyltransferase 1
LFAGIGGFRLAMQDIGGKCVFSSEWDDAAKQTYFENYGEVSFGDITKDETKDLIPKHFDVLCGGFPCQPFSIAGYRKGFDDVRGTLFFDVADILERYKPKAFYLENVKNLKAHDEGRTFEKIKDVLVNRLDYKVFDKVMNPCEYANIPQNRERIFIVGFDPKQLTLPDDFEFKFPEKKKLTKTIHDVIDDTVDDEKLFYRPGHLYYNRMKDVITNPDTVYQWRRVYIRENKSNVCPTLTANMGEGGHNVPIICTSKGIRKFTPEECLGFQGFPVNKAHPYRFPETIAQSKKYKQAGNSVTEPLIELVAKKILQTIETYPLKER